MRGSERARQQPGGAVDRRDRGHRRCRDVRQLDHAADQRVELDGTAVLDVLQHRCLVGADRLGAGDALFDGDLEGDAELAGDGLGLGHDRCDEGATVGVAADAFERGVGQGTDRIEAAVAPQLQPDLGADVLADGRLEAGFHHGLREPLDALAAAAVELAEREAVALDDADPARFHQLCRRVDDAADHAPGIDCRRQHAAGIDAVERAALPLAGQLLEVPPRDAVGHRHQHRLRTDEGSQCRQHVHDLVRLDGEEHGILWAGIGGVGDGTHGARVFLATVFEHEPEAAGADRRKVLVAGEEDDLVAGEREPGAEVAADRTSADDGKPHAGPRPSLAARPMRCSLPVAPFGISSMKRIFFGTL